MTASAPAMGRLEQDLPGFPRGRWADHAPHWRLAEAAGGGAWICDGARPVAFLHRQYRILDVLGGAPDRFRAPVLPEPLHAPTVMGCKLPLDLWVDWRQSGSSANQRVAPQVSVDAAGVTIAVDEAWPELGLESRRRFRFRLDPTWGHVCDLTTAVSGREAHPLEFANLLPAGAADWRPERQRHDRLLWRHPSRGILRWIGNMALLRAAGHRDLDDRRRLAGDGWIAFAGERERNPVLAFRSAAPGISSITCSALLDEHVHFRGEPRRDGDGRLHWTMDASLLSLDGEDLAHLDRQAQDNDLLLDEVRPELAAPPEVGTFHYPFAYDARTPYNPRMHAFAHGGWRDFARPIAADRHFRGAFWMAPEGHPGWASVQPVADAAGGKALVLRGPTPGEVPLSGPDPLTGEAGAPARDAAAERILRHDGTPLWMDPGTRVRVAVMARAVGPAEATLRLELRLGVFSPADPKVVVAAVLRAGDARQWTLLAVEAEVPPPDPALFASLAVTGEVRWEIDRVYLGPPESG